MWNALSLSLGYGIGRQMGAKRLVDICDRLTLLLDAYSIRGGLLPKGMHAGRRATTG